MSSDIGLVCYDNGDFGTLPSGLLLRVLRPYIAHRDEDFWELSFPDGGSGEMQPLDDEPAFDLSISDPSGTDLFDALYEIMRQTHTVLWWTGGDVQVTADENIAAHLPPEFIAENGEPMLVRSGADILAEIAKT